MSTYRIRSGDTLSEIASRYHTSASALARQNGISDADEIRTGQQLRVPGHSTVDSFEPAAGSVASDAGGSQRLADAARRVATGHRSSSHCARGVETALRNAMGVDVRANANQLDNRLPRSQFREVNMSLQEALNTPGMVLTWEHTSTRNGRRYGHTAITAGDGHTSYSDFVERNTSNRGRTGLRVFEPINA